MTNETRTNAQIVPAIRAALPLLAEDPPLSLGRSELATLLLPANLDLRTRGEALAATLTGAIAQLAPRAAVPSTDPRWWAHWIYLGEYIHCRRRKELERQIAISRSTYTRVKRRGLDRIIDLLPYLTRDTFAPEAEEVSQS